MTDPMTQLISGRGKLNAATPRPSSPYLLTSSDQKLEAEEAEMRLYGSSYVEAFDHTSIHEWPYTY